MVLENIVDVPSLLIVRDTILGIAAGLQFNFREGVNIFFKQRIRTLHADRASERCDNLSPGLSSARHCTTFLEWLARHRNASTGFGYRYLRTSCTARTSACLERGVEARDEIDRAVVIRAFDQPKIIGNVLIKILGNNLRVASRYGFRSVHVGV